jgi:hypothetical protein
MATEETDQLRRLRDSLRAAVEAANLVHVHADERGTFGLVRRALALVEGDAPFDAWVRQGEWPEDLHGPEDYGEGCPACASCDGEGTTDGLTDCNQCGGTGRLPF